MLWDCFNVLMILIVDKLTKALLKITISLSLPLKYCILFVLSRRMYSMRVSHIFYVLRISKISEQNVVPVQESKPFNMYLCRIFLSTFRVKIFSLRQRVGSRSKIIFLTGTPVLLQTPLLKVQGGSTTAPSATRHNRPCRTQRNYNPDVGINVQQKKPGKTAGTTAS